MKKSFLVSLLVTLGLVINIVIYCLITNYQNERLSVDYATEVERVSQSLKKEIALNFEALKHLELFYNELEAINRDTFSRVARAAIGNRHSIQAIEWIPKVKQDELSRFEQQQQDFIADFTVKQKRADGQFVDVDERPYYFPITFVEPLQGNESAIGYDLSSNPERDSTLIASIESGQVLASAGIDLIQLKSKDKGFLVFAPIYKKGSLKAEIDSLKGFILGVYRADSLLNEALKGSYDSHSNIKLLDVTNKQSPQLLTEQRASESSQSNLFQLQPLGSVAGREWVLEATASTYFIKNHVSYLPELIFLVGLILLLSAIVFYQQQSRYTDEAESRVKQRTQELLETQNFMINLTNAIPVLLAYVDKKSVFQFTNAKFEELYGLSSKEIIGCTVKSISGDEKYEKIAPYMKCALNGDVVNFQDESYADDALVYQSTTFIPHVNERGNVEGIFVSIEDISQQYKDKEQLERYAQELEFNTWTLEDARDTAEAATKSKSIFLANMSHEIRTPLSGVLGLLNLLSETHLEKEQRDYLNLSISNAETLLIIINDILDLSKVEAGKLEIEPRAFCLFKMLSNLKRTYSYLINEKGLTFEFESNLQQETFIISDEVRLSQIINNLMTNAIKFTAKGGIKLQVELIEESSHLSTLEIAVIDSGIGIAQHQIDKLFNAFEQADKSTSRQYGGTGLGLAISKELAKLMGGNVFVESEINKGSIFRCEIVVESRTQEQRVTQKQGSRSDLQGVHALLVEDNKVNQIIACKMLKSIEIEVTVVNNGQEAIEELQQHHEKYDVIFMDCMMPILDGYEATTIIRNTEGFKDKLIIAMTANAMTGDREKCLSVGMNGYISKPLNKDELVNVINEVLDIEISKS